MELVRSNNSLNSKIIKKIISFSNYKKNTESVEDVKKFINKCNRKELNEKLFKGMIHKKNNDCNYYILNNGLNNNNVLFYIHGGSFIEKPISIQIRFMKKLAKKLNYDLVIPIYKTIPIGSSIDLLTQMQDLYKKLLNDYKNIYLIGDSAGGGAALSLNMELVKNNIGKPKATILFSPWLDVSLSNNKILDVARKDIVCSIEGNRYCGKLWAGKLSENDYRVSPIYGDIKLLNNIFISSSKSEICNPDCIKLISMLKEKNINYEYVEFTNQFHNFELYPIKESNILINDVVHFINEEV